MLIMYGDYWLRLEILVGLIILFYIMYFSKVILYTNYGLREYIKKDKSLHPNSLVTGENITDRQLQFYFS